MSKSLLFQLRNFAKYAAVTLAILVAALPYSYIINGSGTHIGFTIVYHAVTGFILFLLINVYCQNFFSSLTPIALSFGATRKGWGLAGVISCSLYALLCTGIAFLVIEPLAMAVIGLPSLAGFTYLPFALALSLFLAAWGAFCGLALIQYGAKVVVISIVAWIVLFIAIVLIVVIFSLLPALLAFIQNPLSAVPLLVLAALLYFAAWRILRNMEVKG